MSRTPAMVLALALALPGLHGCRKRAPDASSSASAPPADATALAPAPPGTLFPAGVVLGGDRAALQHYLRYVDTVIGARVRVTYAPTTVVLDREAAIRAVHSASWDGVTWRLEAAEPALRQLAPGSVLLIWGLALRRVLQVDHVGDEIVLRTEEAQLTDAVTEADIAWDAPAHLRQGAMVMRVPRAEDSVRFRRASFTAPSASPTPFRLAAFTDQGEARTEGEGADSAGKDPPTLYSESFKLTVNKYSVAMAFGAPSEDALNFYAQFAYGEDAEEPAGLPGELDPALKYGGKFAEWVKKQQAARDKEAKEGKKKAKDIRNESKVTSGPGPGLRQPIPATSEEQQKQKEEEEAEAEYEKKYGKQSRNSTDGKLKLPDMPKVPTSFGDGVGSVWEEVKARTAIKVTTAGTVTGFRSKGDISIKGGKLEHATMENPDFHLTGDVFWAARIDLAVFAGRTHLEVPVTFRVPLIIGGLPMFLEVGVNAQIQPALTSKMATAKGHRHIDFVKNAQLTITPGGVSGEAGDATASAEQGPEERITGLGVSGLMIALQVPRVALGFGIIGSNITGYFDVVVSSGATYTGTTGIIQCTHSLLVANFNVGASATFLGFELYKGERKAGPSKQWDWDNPPGRKCG